MLSREGKKITTFGSQGSSEGQFNGPDGVAITTDNHILVNDRFNHRIQMFTMEGKFVRSVGEENGHFQFINPAGTGHVPPASRCIVGFVSNPVP